MVRWALLSQVDQAILGVRVNHHLQVDRALQAHPFHREVPRARFLPSLLGSQALHDLPVYQGLLLVQEVPILRLPLEPLSVLEFPVNRSHRLPLTDPLAPCRLEHP